MYDVYSMFHETVADVRYRGVDCFAMSPRDFVQEYFTTDDEDQIDILVSYATEFWRQNGSVHLY